MESKDNVDGYTTPDEGVENSGDSPAAGSRIPVVGTPLHNPFENEVFEVSSSSTRSTPLGDNSSPEMEQALSPRVASFTRSATSSSARSAEAYDAPMSPPSSRISHISNVSRSSRLLGTMAGSDTDHTGVDEASRDSEYQSYPRVSVVDRPIDLGSHASFGNLGSREVDVDSPVRRRTATPVSAVSRLSDTPITATGVSGEHFARSIPDSESRSSSIPVRESFAISLRDSEGRSRSISVNETESGSIPISERESRVTALGGSVSRHTPGKSRKVFPERDTEAAGLIAEARKAPMPKKAPIKPVVVLSPARIIAEFKRGSLTKQQAVESLIRYRMNKMLHKHSDRMYVDKDGDVRFVKGYDFGKSRDARGRVIKRNGLTRIEREILAYQKSTHLLIPRAVFARIVREIAQRWWRGPEPVKFTVEALSALQAATEDEITRLLEISTACSYHAKRVTLRIDDIRLARFCRGRQEYEFFNIKS
ncbi:histone H3 [Babesia ovis]|uniref:Histone H3 n=1 Tax=Babesia ovis TaxID=5869 RepID=A0A9W5WVN8_BABOV|nr:histone H3 [Babesia ovis]